MKMVLPLSMIAASAALLAGCNSSEPAQQVKVETVRAQIVESLRQQTPTLVRTTGTLHAHETAAISAQVMGRVQQVLVHEGDVVRAGQALVRLDDATLKASADQAAAAVIAVQHQQAAAQSNADLAASTLARYQQLQVQRSVSPQEIDQVTRQAQAAAAQVEALRAQENAMKAQEAGARTMLGYARIAAPFAGIITQRMVDPGALASPGVPLLQIDSAGPLQLQTTVGESSIGAVRTGMKLTIHVDGAAREDFAGTVAEIVPAADPASHSFLVKIDMPPSKTLRAGMYATADIPTGTHEAILVPRSAVVRRGSLACAYVLDSNSIAQLRYLTLGATQGDAVEVLSGVSGGEKLVANPADRDLAGKRIEVQQ